MGVAGATVGVAVVLATVVGACCCGITSRWPYWTFFASLMLFALRRSSVLIPYFLAMVAGDSLKSTTWIVWPFSWYVPGRCHAVDDVGATRALTVVAAMGVAALTVAEGRLNFC